MGITQKVSQIAGQVQDGVKNSSKSLMGLTLKVLTAFMFSLTIALIAQEMMAFGTLMFIFLMIVVGGALFRLLASWTLWSVVVFDLFLILVALLLRMYILVAP